MISPASPLTARAMSRSAESMSLPPSPVAPEGGVDDLDLGVGENGVVGRDHLLDPVVG